MPKKLERSAGVTALLLSVGVFFTTAAPMAAVSAVPEPDGTAECADTLPLAALSETESESEPEAAPESEPEAEPETAEKLLVALRFAEAEAGTPVELTAENGAAARVSVPESGELAVALCPGRWTLTCGAAEAAFTLTEQAAVRDVTGAAWTDGESLTVTQEPRCTLIVSKRASDAPEGTQWLYRLEGADGTACRVIVQAEGGELSCTFWNLAPGSYSLYEDDLAVAAFTLTADVPTRQITIP
jgi:hypothetical protein